MTKQNKPVVYAGSDSYGRPNEVAIRHDGKTFFREFGYNGYGVGYTKWQEYTRPIVYVTKIENKYSGEVVELDDRTRYIEWGFNTLERVDGARVRLPK